MLHNVDCGDICVYSAHIRLAVNRTKKCAPKCVGFIYKLGGFTAGKATTGYQQVPESGQYSMDLVHPYGVAVRPIIGCPSEETLADTVHCYVYFNVHSQIADAGA